MHKTIFVSGLFAAAMLAGNVAHAKLPPPTPAEQEAAAAKEVETKVLAEKQKVLLGQAQDRIAARYGAGMSNTGATTQAKDMPKASDVAPKGVGPTPQQQQSGESHSAPAK